MQNAILVDVGSGPHVFHTVATLIRSPGDRLLNEASSGGAERGPVSGTRMTLWRRDKGRVRKCGGVPAEKRSTPDSR